MKIFSLILSFDLLYRTLSTDSNVYTHTNATIFFKFSKGRFFGHFLRRDIAKPGRDDMFIVCEEGLENPERVFYNT